MLTFSGQSHIAKMSGQYPSGFPNSVGNHQQNFTNQMNPMRNQMMNMGLSNQMGLLNYNQSGMMHQQQQSQPIQNNNLGGMGQSNLSNVGMPSPSHSSQQQQSQVAQQLQQTSQLSLQTSTSNSGNVSSLITSQQGVVSQQSNSLTTSVPAVNQQQPLPQKEFNIVSLCRFGQETVQDILSRFQEVFAALKSVQPPNSSNSLQTGSATTEKKVTEQFRTIRLLFKRLRLLFDKCNDSCQQGKWLTINNWKNNLKKFFFLQT